MEIGYACMALYVYGSEIHSCIQKNATPERLAEITQKNLSALNNMLEYNFANGIRLFRVSSDIIPFGSSPVNNTDWQGKFAVQLENLGLKAKTYGIRLSMHPGQYTVLNSANPAVFANAAKDIEYHTDFLGSLKADKDCVIIVHTGGTYGDKKASAERFIENYGRLCQNIKERLALENDDTCYNIADILEINGKTGIPVVYDVLHNRVNPHDKKPDGYRIEKCLATWKNRGKMKIHYSQQKQGCPAGTHSNDIKIEEFMDFYNEIKGYDVDVMLEAKNKNISATKCISCISGNIAKAKKDISKYRFLLLERETGPDCIMPERVSDIIGAYARIERIIELPVTEKGFLNAAAMVLDITGAGLEEKKTFDSYMSKYRGGKVGMDCVRNYLCRLCGKALCGGSPYPFYF